MAAGFFLNVAALIVPLALVKPPDNPGEAEAKTNVQIVLGSGDSSMGGACPHVALWDNSKFILWTSTGRSAKGFIRWKSYRPISSTSKMLYQGGWCQSSYHHRTYTNSTSTLSSRSILCHGVSIVEWRHMCRVYRYSGLQDLWAILRRYRLYVWPVVVR
jgi:hypothetical protein